MGRALELKEQTKKEIKKIICLSLRSGSSISKACMEAGISRNCFYDWVQWDGNFKRAIAYAKASRVHLVEDALFKSALEGDVTAQKFFLTNRSPEEWKERNALINQGIIQQGADGSNMMPTQINFIGVDPDEHRIAEEGTKSFIEQGKV